VNDGGREVDAYVVDNPHAAGMLIAYVPDMHKLGIVSDLYVSGRCACSGPMQWWAPW